MYEINRLNVGTTRYWFLNNLAYHKDINACGGTALVHCTRTGGGVGQHTNESLPSVIGVSIFEAITNYGWFFYPHQSLQSCSPRKHYVITYASHLCVKPTHCE